MKKDNQHAAPVGLLIQLLSDRLASRQVCAHGGDASSFLVFFGRCSTRQLTPDRDPAIDQSTDATKVQCLLLGLLTGLWGRVTYR